MAATCLPVTQQFLVLVCRLTQIVDMGNHILPEEKARRMGIL